MSVLQLLVLATTAVVELCFRCNTGLLLLMKVGIVVDVAIVVEVGGLATVFATFANDVASVVLIVVVVAVVFV